MLEGSLTIPRNIWMAESLLNFTKPYSLRCMISHATGSYDFNIGLDVARAFYVHLHRDTTQTSLEEPDPFLKSPLDLVSALDDVIILGKLEYVTHLNCSAMKGDDSPISKP